VAEAGGCLSGWLPHCGGALGSCGRGDAGMTHAQLWLAVLERDDRTCQDCGCYAVETHHIVGRRREGAWDVRNMITLCPMCHRGRDKGAGAHTHAARLRHIALLRAKHGYDYSDMGGRWTELVRELGETNH